MSFEELNGSLQGIFMFRWCVVRKRAKALFLGFYQGKPIPAPLKKRTGIAKGVASLPDRQLAIRHLDGTASNGVIRTGGDYVEVKIPGIVYPQAPISWFENFGV